MQMKMTILALTAFVLAVAPLSAQDETETPAPAPEATAPEQSETPASDPSVSVTTEKSESTEPVKGNTPSAYKKGPNAGPTKTSSPAKSSSTSATKTATPATTVMPVKKSTAEATLREIENKWEASIASHDPSVIQAYVANDYRGVSSKGKVLNKSALLAQIKSDTDTYTSAKNGRMDVRVFDGRFAVVVGTSTEEGKGKDGKAFKRNFRWTDAWVERNGKWQCVASQAMALSK
jgi:ketosteroid isomerase-like protein